MAFENGDNAFNYAVSIFEKYKKDDMIFFKALQIIQMYQKRVDYPYCIEELSRAVSRILGGPFQTFFFHGYIFMDDKDAVWNPRESYDPRLDKEIDLVAEYSDDAAATLTDKYSSEIQAFTMAVQPMCEYIFNNDHLSAGMGIKSIAYNESNEKLRKIRIIRDDDVYLDIALTKEQTNFVIDQLSRVFAEG